MLRDVFSKSLRDQRRSLLWWSVAVISVTVVICAFYPSVRQNSAGLNNYLASLPASVRAAFFGGSLDFSSPMGYLDSKWLGLTAPVLFMAYGILAGARAAGGEEDDGTLSLLLSYPVSRRRFTLQKYAAFLLGCVVVGTAHWLALVVGGAIGGITVSSGRLLGVNVALVLLAWAVGSVAFCGAAVTGRRGTGAAVGGAVAAAAFLLNTFALMLSSLAPLKYVSLFHYFGGGEPLRSGLSPLGVVVLAATALVFLGVSVAAMERRDLRL
jgi:ABC-2 type transport system permease protein